MRTETPVLIRRTGVAFIGVCRIALKGICKTGDGVPRAITAVWDDQDSQVDVCMPCLEEKLRRGDWAPGERSLNDHENPEQGGK
jgi:hypothetical protein